MSVAVAERQIDINQSGSGQSAQQDRFFDEHGFFAQTRRLQSGRGPADPSADNGDIIFDRKIHLPTS